MGRSFGQNPYKSPARIAFTSTSYAIPPDHIIPTGHTINGVSALLLTKVTNPNNQLVSYYHDVWGQLLKVRDHTNPTTAYSDTEYDYDLLGNLLAVNTKEPSSNGSGAVLRAVSMSYDAFGRKTGMVDPDMGTWQYVYDPAGHLTAQIANNANKLCFTYDSFGRPLTKFDDSLNAGLTSCPAPPTSGDTHLATYTYGTSAANYNFGRPADTYLPRCLTTPIRRAAARKREGSRTKGSTRPGSSTPSQALLLSGTAGTTT